MVDFMRLQINNDFLKYSFKYNSRILEFVYKKFKVDLKI